MTRYVDLKRTFTRIEQEPEARVSDPELERWRWLDWPMLVAAPRVVLLAEAASGKTVEFQQCRLRLRKEGRPAFFVSIEDLAERGFQASLAPEDLPPLQRWRDQPGPAWFFLDSLDEARLNRKRFDTALRLLARELGEAVARAHVLVSCRVSDWKGREDLDAILSSLPLGESTLGEETTASSSAENDAQRLLVVQLVPLSGAQRAALARACGIADVNGFLAAIARLGLEAMAERPGDLLELAEYWRIRGRFASFAEMVDLGIDRKLTEIDKYRGDNEVLTPARAREGAERIAAALTLGKTFTLRAPGSEAEPELLAAALDPALVLDDWSDAERNALTRRGIFAPATYGRVRFHHRSTQEYLAAQWFQRLLRQGCTQLEMCNVLFANVHGAKAIVPSLRAATAWLSLWNPSIREEVISREASLLWHEADPGSLPIDVRRKLLALHVRSAEEGRIRDLRHDRLLMFADTELADTLRALWPIATTLSTRGELLLLIGSGAVASCIDIAREVAFDSTAHQTLRAAAIGALHRCGDVASLARLAPLFRDVTPATSATLIDAYVECLFPEFLSAEDLMTFLESLPVLRSTVGQLATPPQMLHYAYAMKDIARSTPEPNASEARTQQYLAVHSIYAVLAERLIHFAEERMGRRDEERLTAPFLRLLQVIQRIGQQSGRGDQRALREHFADDWQLTRALFWADISQARARFGNEDQVVQVAQDPVDGAHLWRLSKRDAAWLRTDIAAKAAPEDRFVALRTLMHAMREHSPIHLPQALEARGPRVPPVLKNSRHLREAGEYIAQQRMALLEIERSLDRDPDLLVRADAEPMLARVTQWLRDHRPGNGQSGLSCAALAHVWGEQATARYAAAMRLAWRRAPAPSPEQGALRSDDSLALTAILLEAVDEQWGAGLTDEEAEHAACHLLHAYDFPKAPLAGLARAHEGVVRRVAQQRLLLAWNGKGAGRSLLAAPQIVWPAVVASALSDVLASHEPVALATLCTAIAYLAQAALPAKEWERLASVSWSRWREHVAREQDADEMKFRWGSGYWWLLLLSDPRRAIREARPRQEREFGDSLSMTIEGWLRQKSSALGLYLDRAASTELESLWSFAQGPLVDVSAEDLSQLAVFPRLPSAIRLHVLTKWPRPLSSRRMLFEALTARSDASAYASLVRIAEQSSSEEQAFVHEYLKRMVQRDAEPPAWSAADVVAFERKHAAPVNTPAALLRTVENLLAEIQTDLRNHDASSRELLRLAPDEESVKQWLAEQLRLRAQGRYHVYCEPQVADGDMPDIVIAAASGAMEVAIEIKHAGKRWTVKQLEHALTDQLAERYLKPASRRHGVLVLTHHSKRAWRCPDTGAVLDFAQVVQRLERLATGLAKGPQGPVDVRVAGIDATLPARPPIA